MLTGYHDGIYKMNHESMFLPGKQSKHFCHDLERWWSGQTRHDPLEAGFVRNQLDGSGKKSAVRVYSNAFAWGGYWPSERLTPSPKT